MGGWGAFVMVGLVASSVQHARAQSAVPPPAACGGDIVGAGTVRAIADGRSFELDDGRSVRLAAVEVPLPVLGESGAHAAAGLAARMALESIVAGQRIELRQREAVTDRYGRAVTHAFVVADGRERNVAQAMLAQGHARVAADVGDRDCATVLLALERAAREANLGLCGERYYGIVGAQNGAELLTGMRPFGAFRSDALTVTIWKRNERTFTAAGLQPKMLENRHVRVRGWIEERNGPRIEARHPEQIEIAERN